MVGQSTTVPSEIGTCTPAKVARLQKVSKFCQPSCTEPQKPAGWITKGVCYCCSSSSSIQLYIH